MLCGVGGAHWRDMLAGRVCGTPGQHVLVGYSGGVNVLVRRASWIDW